ncbi:NAD(P)-binding oxidoreductase [Natronoarchaeum rubrum]|uniref:NAD(P)-binding oxidoreductase n=1 Tax=Natronoarchaeum rubrum TaxID=755311 RepID=UPI002112A351|nr:NAD(P)-binding oxidoreductase [Natronoarchaeum rubrum]
MSAPIERALVAGASGGTGREILTQLRNAGVLVRAMTRSAETELELKRRGADEVVVGDLLEPADAVRAVEDCDAVFCAVGTGPSPRHLLGGDLVDRTGVANLLTAAVAEGVDRFVYESAIGVGNSAPGMPLPFRLAIRATLAAKDASENALRASGLTYTIVRPGRLTDDRATGDVLVGRGGDTVAGSIPRADVARLMVAAPFTPDARNETFEVVSREGLRGDADGLIDVDWRVPEAATEP